MRYFLTGERAAVLSWLNEKKWQYVQNAVAVKRIRQIMNSLLDPEQAKKFKPKSGDENDETVDLVSVTLDINLNER